MDDLYTTVKMVGMWFHCLENGELKMEIRTATIKDVDKVIELGSQLSIKEHTYYDNMNLGWMVRIADMRIVYELKMATTFLPIDRKR